MIEVVLPRPLEAGSALKQCCLPSTVITASSCLV
jgi:hypothetical protein